jgi:hypothetical protein
MLLQENKKQTKRETSNVVMSAIHGPSVRSLDIDGSGKESKIYAWDTPFAAGYTINVDREADGYKLTIYM